MFAPMYATPDRITSNLTAAAANQVIDWWEQEESEPFRFCVEVYSGKYSLPSSRLFDAESEAQEYLENQVIIHQGEGEFSLFDGEFYYNSLSDDGVIGVGPSQRIDIL